MPRGPRILASFLHDTLGVIDGMDAGLGEQVRAALKPELLAEIQEAWAASWLPIGHDVAVTEAFFRLAGEQRACEAMRQNLVATFEKPILRPIIEGALRVLGADTARLLGWSPRAFGLLFRDVGEMSVEIGAGADTATIRLTGLPPEVADSRAYLLGMAAALSAVFTLTGADGRANLAAAADGEARFELSWQHA